MVEVRGFLEDLNALSIKAQSSFQAILDLRQVGVVGQLKPNGLIGEWGQVLQSAYVSDI